MAGVRPPSIGPGGGPPQYVGGPSVIRPQFAPPGGPLGPPRPSLGPPSGPPRPPQLGSAGGAFRPPGSQGPMKPAVNGPAKPQMGPPGVGPPLSSMGPIANGPPRPPVNGNHPMGPPKVVNGSRGPSPSPVLRPSFAPPTPFSNAPPQPNSQALPGPPINSQPHSNGPYSLTNSRSAGALSGNPGLPPSTAQQPAPAPQPSISSGPPPVNGGIYLPTNRVENTPAPILNRPTTPSSGATPINSMGHQPPNSVAPPHPNSVRPPPPTFTGPTPPNSMGPPQPISTGPLPPNSMGPPQPISTGPLPPNSMGPPQPKSMGPPPPNSMGPMPPNLMGPPTPNSMGPSPPNLLGPQPPNSSYPQTPTSQTGLSNSFSEPNNLSARSTGSTFARRYPPSQATGGTPIPGMTQPPMGGMAQPPVSGVPGMGPTPMVGQPPVSGMGAPPIGPPMGAPPPLSGMGPPPMGGHPPVTGMGPPHAPPQVTGPPNPLMGGPPPMGLQGGPPPTGGPAPIGGPPPMPGMAPPLRPQTDTRFGQNHQATSLSGQLGGLSITQTGFQKMWGQESVDLLQNRHILPAEEVIPPKPKLQAEQWNQANCSPDVFRCTLTRIPETEALLKKARLPLGILIHPFKDLSHLPVIQCTTIVRCRSCRTYINPFVHFVDQRRWRCNLCYRVNELPEEFLYDPVSKSYGDPSRRPECRSSTIEFIAPQEYMLRPPQPAVYLFLLDVSRQALETGYLRSFCDTMIDELDKLPGDSRTQVGFITYSRTLQFYQIAEGSSQATQLVVGDVDDVFLPSPCDLVINLANCKEQVTNMLTDLPELFNGSQESDNCLGAALQAAYKMVYQTGGRITVVQASMPNIGPGAVKSREGEKGAGETALLNPSTDFYKKLALDCSGQQIAVDLFVLNNQHCDLATVSGISKFSGGQVQTFPGYHNHQNTPQAERFERCLRRYLTRKIGFEAVMRIRCTRGMSLHTFHGHFFVRSTDLLSLPNVNPDTAFGMQVSIEEDLKDSREVSFQAALLYTSSKGERRIRVHTLCIPTSASLQETVQGADQHCIVGLLAKMAVDRTLNSTIADAREAFINVCVDTIERWKMVQCISQPGVLPASSSLKLIPLLILALLKTEAFSTRPGVKLDERTGALIQMKCLPLTSLIQSIYPDMYRVDSLDTAPTREDEEGVVLPNPPRLQLSAEKIAMNGAYLLDCGEKIILFLGKVLQPFFCERIFGVAQPNLVDENLTDLPELDNEDSERLRLFVQSLNSKKSHAMSVRVVRDDSKSRNSFISMLVDDRSEASYSYYEFLQHLKTQIK